MKYDKDNPDEQRYSLLRRWSMRKLEAIGESRNDSQQQQVTEDSQLLLSATDAPCIEQEAEVPDVDTLTENSDLAAYFSEQVSEALRKTALRKIFRLDKFNICDGLDDYAEDYTTFESLGDIFAAKLKLRKVSERVKYAADFKHREENIPGVPYGNVEDADDDNRINGEAPEATTAEEEIQLQQPGVNPVTDKNTIEAKSQKSHGLSTLPPTTLNQQSHTRKKSLNSD